MAETDWYEVFKRAETGGFNNPWIRTVGVPGSSSSAFGPVQITKTKAEDYVKRGAVSPESAAFYTNVMAPMYDKFLRYGRAPKKAGYRKEYDYGGSGNFDPAQYGVAYQRLAEEMLAYDAKLAKGDLSKLIALWRGKGNDARYNAAIKKALKEYNTRRS